RGIGIDSRRQGHGRANLEIRNRIRCYRHAVYDAWSGRRRRLQDVDLVAASREASECEEANQTRTNYGLHLTPLVSDARWEQEHDREPTTTPRQPNSTTALSAERSRSRAISPLSTLNR